MNYYADGLNWVGLHFNFYAMIRIVVATVIRLLKSGRAWSTTILLIASMASVSSVRAQFPSDRAKFRKGTCSIPPKTIGFFYPIPLLRVTHILHLSADEGWFSIREHGWPALLIHIDAKTAFAGFRALTELKSGDPIKVRFLADEQENFIAQSIERLPRPLQVLRGAVSEIAGDRPPPAAFGISGQSWVLVTNETIWRNAHPSELLPGHRVIVTSVEDRWWDTGEELELVQLAQSVEVEDINEIQIGGEIGLLDRNAAYVKIRNLPFPISLTTSQLETYDQSKDVWADIKARNEGGGKWVATDVSFSAAYDIVSNLRINSWAFPGIFTWEDASPNVWPTQPIRAEEAPERLSFSHKREKKYPPILWILSLGFLAIPERDIIDVELDQGKDTEEFCEFEIGAARLKTSLNAIQNRGFGTTH